MEFKKIISLTTKYQDKISNLCAPLYDFFKFANFNLYVIHSDGLWSVINTDPILLKYYLFNKYYICDPHIVHPKKLKPGVAIWSTYNDFHYRGKLLYNLEKIFNISDGISIVKNINANCYVYSFGFPYGNTQVPSRSFSNIYLLMQFIGYFYKKGGNIIKKFVDSSVDISKLKGEKFFSQSGITSDSNLTKVNINNFMRCIEVREE